MLRFATGAEAQSDFWFHDSLASSRPVSTSAPAAMHPAFEADNPGAATGHRQSGLNPRLGAAFDEPKPGLLQFLNRLARPPARLAQDVNRLARHHPDFEVS